jgi:hypothetical protein
MSQHPGQPTLFKLVRLISIPLLLIILIAITVLTVSAWAWLLPTAKDETPATNAQTTAAAPVSQRDAKQERVETELITIRSTGFEPHEITRPEGRVFFEVDNRSGLPEINLRLSSEHGNRLHQARVRREQLDWHQELDLRPGRYVLTEANHTDWVCRITITAR